MVCGFTLLVYFTETGNFGLNPSILLEMTFNRFICKAQVKGMSLHTPGL